MTDEFGSAYAQVILNDLALTDLGDKTASQAIAAGADPKDVWFAVCNATQVPKTRWHGINKKPTREN